MIGDCLCIFRSCGGISAFFGTLSESAEKSTDHRMITDHRSRLFLSFIFVQGQGGSPFQHYFRSLHFLVQYRKMQRSRHTRPENVKVPLQDRGSSQSARHGTQRSPATSELRDICFCRGSPSLLTPSCPTLPAAASFMTRGSLPPTTTNAK